MLGVKPAIQSQWTIIEGVLWGASLGKVSIGGTKDLQNVFYVLWIQQFQSAHQHKPLCTTYGITFICCTTQLVLCLIKWECALESKVLLPFGTANCGAWHGSYIIEEIGCGGFFVDGRHACESLRNVFSQDGKFVCFPSNLMSSPVLAASSKIKLYRSSVVGQFWRRNKCAREVYQDNQLPNKL